MLGNADVIKVRPSFRCDHGDFAKSVVWFRQTVGGRDEHRRRGSGRDWMDGKLPLLRGTTKSITFTLGWLAVMGAKRIIIAGCDLKAGHLESQRYAYPGRGKGDSVRRRHGHRGGLISSLNQTYNLLTNFAKSAAKHGIELLSWSPGSRLEEIMESYDGRCSRQAAGDGGGAAEVRFDEGGD